MIVGCVLVVVILVAFLFDWRTALISLTAIPLSLIAATLVLIGDGRDDQHDGPGRPGDRDGRGRRRRDHRRREHRPAAPAEPGGGPARGRRSGSCSTASLEVRSAVVYASLIVILVFVPVFFLEGLAGLVLPAAGPGLRAGDPGVAAGGADGHAGAVADAPDRARPSGGASRRWSGCSRRSTARSCRRSSRRPGWAVAVLVVAFAATGWAVAGLGEEFLPELPGERLPDALGREAGHVARGDAADHRAAPARSCAPIPGVRNFGSHIGRAEVADEVVGPNFTELWISVDPEGRPRQDDGQDPGRSSTATPGLYQRRADLPEGADQGGADRRRAPRWWCGSSAPTSTCSAPRRRRSTR